MILRSNKRPQIYNKRKEEKALYDNAGWLALGIIQSSVQDSDAFLKIIINHCIQRKIATEIYP